MVLVVNVFYEQNAEQVIRLFDSVMPDGRTPIGERLDELLRDYIDLLDERARGPRERRPKPVNFIVLTDGVPSTSPPHLHNVLTLIKLNGYLL